MGSIGVGCTVDKRVIAKVELSETNCIYFNKELVQFPTVNTIVEKLAQKPVKVMIESKLPLGFGFGISGASSLACAFALNRFFNLRKAKTDLISIAHSAEIAHHTGLGSVGTQSVGGLLLKTSPGISFKYRRFPFTGRKIYSIAIDKLETPAILLNKKILKEVNQAADRAILRIKKADNLSFVNLIDIAYQFCLESHLLHNRVTQDIIQEIRKERGVATMAILGQNVISSIRPKTSFGYPVYEMTVCQESVDYY